MPRRRPFRSSARRFRHHVRKSASSEVRSVDQEILALRLEKSVLQGPLQPGRRMRRPYKDMPLTRPLQPAGAFHGYGSIRAAPTRSAVMRTNLAVRGSRSTTGVGNRQSGGRYKPGDPRVTPTKICPLQCDYGRAGAFHDPVSVACVTMTIRDHLRLRQAIGAQMPNRISANLLHIRFNL